MAHYQRALAEGGSQLVLELVGGLVSALQADLWIHLKVIGDEDALTDVSDRDLVNSFDLRELRGDVPYPRYCATAHSWLRVDDHVGSRKHLVYLAFYGLGYGVRLGERQMPPDLDVGINEIFRSGPPDPQ